MDSPAAELAELCGLLESALGGGLRSAVVQQALAADDDARTVRALRGILVRQLFVEGESRRDFAPLVHRLDQRTRDDGFRVLHSWDHTAHVFTEDPTPILMLDHFASQRSEGSDVETAAGVLLDYYFLHLLSLCAMRAWDDEDPDAVLDRVTDLIGTLQGTRGSGHRFAGDAETLLIYALSQFHPDEHAYDRFVDRTEVLRPERRVRLAALSAGVLSAHLRWGLWLMYDRDVLRMRNDNVGDYPWLLDSVLTLMRAYVASREAGEVDPESTARVLEALTLGLAADPWAFTGRPPPALVPYTARHDELKALLARHGEALLEDMEPHRPTKEAYAPLALHFNFPHNTLVALVAMALESGVPQTLSIDELLTAEEPSQESGRATAPGHEEVARALMAYSGASPDRLGAHGAMLVAYDPLTAMRSYAMMRKAIQEIIPS